MADPRSLEHLLENAPLDGKSVLLRADLNVPMDNQGRVTDTTRLDRLLPTLQDITHTGARVLVLSHFGRPGGHIVPELSLKPVAKALENQLGKPVAFVADCIGKAAETARDSLPNGSVLVLENTRFYTGEEENDPAFARALARLGSFYVNDAFSTAHRAHASTHALARLLPAFAGRGMETEIKALHDALSRPKRPLIAVVGGAKIRSKIDLLDHLVRQVDTLVIGGGMANTFLAAQGIETGKSLCEKDLADVARDILARAQENHCTLLLPQDVIVARQFRPHAPSETTSVNAVPADSMILDMGPKSLNTLSEYLEKAGTVIWNGPLGAFETPPFDQATNKAAAHVAMLTRQGRLTSVAGGGDTVAALNNAGVADGFSCVSTAGGAFLEWLEGKTLPGIAALEARDT